MTAANTYRYNDRDYTLRELEKMSGINIDTLRWRISQGMSVSDALTKKVERPCKLYSYHGKMLSIAQISMHSRVSSNAIRERLHKGWSVEDAADLPVGANAKHKGGRAAESMPDADVTSGMSPEELIYWNAAKNIARTIADGKVFDFGFRCITPLVEYAFDGDIIGWRIRFFNGGRRAALTAHYLKDGFDSDFRRLFAVSGDIVKEIEHD